MSPIQIPIDAITARFGDRFNSIRSQSIGTRFANLRPVSEFLDVKRISKPANFGEVQSRVNYNLSYFSSNYVVVFVMLGIYSLLTNPVLLFVIVLVSGGLYGIGKLQGRDLDLGVARFNTSQLYTALLCIAVPLGFWASPFATALWLIGATGGGLGGRPRAPYGTPRWGRPPGAQVGRQTGRRGGQWAEKNPQIEEIGSSEEDQYVLREDRTLYARQLASLLMDGGNGWQRHMMEYDEQAKAPGPEDGMDYDLYEDTDSTVAYAIQLAMKDKEEWLVDKALERIRRAQSQGQKNVRLSKRELEALERKRKSGDRDSGRKNSSPKANPVDNRRAKAAGDSLNNVTETTGVRGNRPGVSPKKPTPPTPPYPLTDPCSVYDTWARSTGSAIGNQSPHSPQSASSLRMPLQPPFSPERHYGVPRHRPPASFASTAYPHPFADGNQWIPPYPMPFSVEQPSYKPNYQPVFGERHAASPQESFPTASVTQEPVAPPPNPDLKVDGSKDKNSSGGGGDEAQVVEVVERKIPSTPTRTAAGRGSRQRSSRS